MNKKLVDALIAAEALGGGIIIGAHAARQQTAVENASDDMDEPEWYKVLDRIGQYGDTMFKAAAWSSLIILQKAALYEKYGWELPVRK